MLAGRLYMLRVYDRVLPSHSVTTLIALSILLIRALALVLPYSSTSSIKASATQG